MTANEAAPTLPDTPQSLLPLVRQAMAATPDARLRELMDALVCHLHAFVLETRLTEAEFETALDALNAIGQTTNTRHNEAVLMADLLGVSSLVALQAHADPHGHSDAALLGPFWRANAPLLPPGATIADAATPGLPLEVRGTVRSLEGRPVAGAVVDVWQASPKGLYENQDAEQPEMNLRGRFETDAEGRFFLRSVRPAGYPVPTHGPAGTLLEAQRRQPCRPAHLHFMISKPGFKVLVTQVFPHDDAHLADDPVFGVTQRLVGRFETVERDGRTLALLDHPFTLMAGEMVFPKPPIG
jgi:catechol 1,2-dioxygenase